MLFAHLKRILRLGCLQPRRASWQLIRVHAGGHRPEPAAPCQAAGAPPRKDCFDLNRAINQMIKLAQSAITKNEVSVRTRLAEGLFPVQGDRVQLQQVVLNLILNAVEAMGSVEAGHESCCKARRVVSWWQCAIQGRALLRIISGAFSSLSTPQNPAGLEWGYRSVDRSSMPMGVGYGQM
jgi:hypothetical protein